MARDLIVTQNITIDSVIDASGDWFVPGSEDPDHVAEMREVEERLRATADALFVGRLTFDEYRLFVHPVVLGQGRQLFEGPAERRKLELAETHAFTSGIVLLRYRAA